MIEMQPLYPHDCSHDSLTRKTCRDHGSSQMWTELLGYADIS
jgi:hypothetical protein